MLPLTYDLRSLLTTVGTILCISSVLLAPLAASQPTIRYDAAFVGSHKERIPTLSFDRSSALKNVAIVRDPFVEPPGIAARMRRERGARPSDGGIVVEGIVVGERPRALVRIGTTEQIVAVGDILDGDTVTEIRGDEVRFSSGLTVRPARNGPQ